MRIDGNGSVIGTVKLFSSRIAISLHLPTINNLCIMKSKLFLISAIALLIGCAKQGPVGPTGEQGPAGTNGTNGSANVKTTIDSIIVGQWTGIAGGYSAGFGDLNITAADSEYVSVSVATANTANATWYALPYSGVLSAGDQLEFSYSTQQVFIQYNYTTSPTVTLYVKVTVGKPAAIQHKSANIVGKATN
jgi:hypothetical protein